MKIGTIKKPLILEKEKSNRPLIEQHVETNMFEFKDLKKDGNDYFIRNVCGNQFLTMGRYKACLVSTTNNFLSIKTFQEAYLLN